MCLSKIKSDEFDQSSGIKSTNYIVSYGPNSVVKSIEIRGGPDLYYVKNSEKSEDQEEGVKLDTHDKAPGNEHANNFINHNPLRIM